MPRIGTPEQWLAERRALLEREKELTRLGDELARARRELPWVPVDEEYVFDTPDGPRTLAELFRGRSQLLVYHFMFGPGWEAGCASCSSLADHLELPRVHLEHHDVAVTLVSRAPLEEIEPYRARMGWTIPWASSHRSDFNFHFGVSAAPGAPPARFPYNFAGDGLYAGMTELPGMSAFALRDGRVFHTYSAHARGLDALWGMYQWLDRMPLGRNESGDAGTAWLRRRDEYEAVAAA